MKKKLRGLLKALLGRKRRPSVCFPLSQGASECLARKGAGSKDQTGNHWKVEQKGKKGKKLEEVCGRETSTAETL